MSQRTGQGIVQEQRSIEGGVVVRVVGEIDYSNSAELRVALIAAAQTDPGKVIVDLAGVGYMDSSGVATLVEAVQALKSGSGQLILCCLQSKVRGMIEIAKLDSVFAIADTVDDAVGS